MLNYFPRFLIPLGADALNVFLALMVVEIGLITPPVGMNVYIINSLARDVPMAATVRGVVPFVVSDCVRVALLVFFPVLSLALVRLLA
jgi:C4-dicarboxylate transporter DctM subunit